MNKTQMSLGCLGILVILALGLFFAKFLVPIVPIMLGLLVFYMSEKFRATTFRAPQHIKEITAGQVLLEGTVTKYNEEATSPYFEEKCVCYVYNKIEYIPTDDGYSANVLLKKSVFKSFTLRTKFGSIKVDGNQLDLNQLKSKTYTEHSLKPDVNDICHEEYRLQDGDQIVLSGTAVKSFYQGFEIVKVGNEPFFVTTRNKIEAQKRSFQLLKSLFPWMLVIYIVVNYFLFFAPSNPMLKSDLFTVVAIFGLPIMFVIFWLLGRDKTDWISQTFQYLAGVCILSSLLTFPLLILFYKMDLEFYRIFYILISIVSTTALALLFNYKKLLEYNSLKEN